ncbi:MAG: N-acetyltransferase [Spirochaetales bacterium]|nr:N-acetyltransferase [Spirochaetales bacterium]
MNITIRTATEQDYRAIEEVNREAFWNLYFPGCNEHYLAHELRQHLDYIPEMDFVALVDGKVVGSIIYSRSYIEDEESKRVETLTFGPFCVHPAYQGRGVGTTLINHSIEEARKRGAKAIIILGDPRNYCRHGFKSSRDYHISDSSGRYPFGQLALVLEEGFFEGKLWHFHYSPAFEMDMKGLDQFDSSFPPKEKKHQPSQDLFSIAIRAYLD